MYCICHTVLLPWFCMTSYFSGRCRVSGVINPEWCRCPACGLLWYYSSTHFCTLWSWSGTTSIQAPLHLFCQLSYIIIMWLHCLLYTVCVLLDIQVVCSLLDHGAHIDIRDAVKFSPLHIASNFGHEKVTLFNFYTRNTPLLHFYTRNKAVYIWNVQHN